jgi:transposase
MRKPDRKSEPSDGRKPRFKSELFMEETMTRTVALEDLTIDDRLIYLRKINLFKVNEYQQRYRAGVDMGEIVVDDTMRIVSGNHRVTAMINEYGPDHEIDVTVRKFKNWKHLLSEFARYNASHGMPLSSTSRRLITIDLIKEGASLEECSTLFGVSVKRIEEWGNMTVVVFGKKGKSRLAPCKRNAEPGTKMTEEQYAIHMRADIGVKAVTLADQLIREIEEGYEYDEKTISKLLELADIIYRKYNERSAS